MQYRGRLAHPTVMRISMINCMALAFVFAMFVELTTESKDLSVIVTLLGVCTPTIWILRPRTLLDAVEVAIGSLMSVAMSVMLLGMITSSVVWLILCAFIVVELLLYLGVRRQIRFG